MKLRTVIGSFGLGLALGMAGLAHAASGEVAYRCTNNTVAAFVMRSDDGYSVKVIHAAAGTEVTLFDGSVDESHSGKTLILTSAGMSLSIDLGKKVQRPGQVLDGEDDPIAVTVVGYVGKLGVGNETVREPMKVFCTAQN